MPRYAALLGHHPMISLAELSARVPGFALVKVVSKQWALFDGAEELPPSLIDSLGGTIVIAQAVGNDASSLGDAPNILVRELEDKRGKLVFALRCANVPKAIVRTFYRNGKLRLKRLGKICRYVGSDRRPAFPVQLHDEEMLTGKRGCELTIIVDAEAAREEALVPPLEMPAWIGRTIGAQDVDRYTKRDIGKPVRDTRTGLLPPKLAQVLLNFGQWLTEEAVTGGAVATGTRKKAPALTVYDPFCGTGVIPMECLLRGWHALASDVSQRAISGCTANLDWLRKEEKILKKDVASDVFKHDATKPFDFKAREEIDVIVTETSLGPALAQRPTLAETKKARTQIEDLEADFLRNAAANLPGVPIVLILPFWRLKTGPLFLEKIWQAMDRAGYTPVLPPYVEPDREGGFSLLYRRPDQFVGREIVLLKPRKR